MIVLSQAVDDAGHDRSVARKVEWIGRVDRMIGRLVELLSSASSASSSSPYVLVVTADHSTPVLYGDHANEPVPLLMAAISPSAVSAVDNDDEQPQSMLSELLRADSNVAQFNEVSCSEGVLGRIPGKELMPLVHRFCLLVRDHYRI